MGVGATSKASATARGRRTFWVRMMPPEIAVVWNRPNDRRIWLPRLGEWLTTNGDLLNRLGVKTSMQSFNSPDAALRWRAELPNERLVVTSGFNRDEIENCKNFALSSGEPIIVGDAASADSNASASFLCGDAVVSCRDVRPQLRKSLIRAALRQQFQIRPPKSDAELAAYFTLRYKIWDAVGYLRSENRLSRVKIEVDIWDRSAVPICAIDRNGRVVGCARLISPFGVEQTYVSKIQKLLDSIDDPQLHYLFKYPNSPQPPFDILFEFPGFGARFQELLKAQTKLAEIGRVAVDPDYRGQSLSEALVDTATSSARAKGISHIFLACSEELASLYAKCGFAIAPGLRSEKFFNIQRPSIVMERPL